MGNSDSELPWPHWLLRFVGSDDPQALEDLIWSVGGSPPYGGVSFEEAEAVYELIEAYRGPGEAPPESYARVESFVVGRPEASKALAVFQCNDAITSASSSYGRGVVERGLALSRDLAHRGAEGTFLAFLAGVEQRDGDLAAARRATLDALAIFLELVEEDPVYEKRVAQNAQNAISFTALGGDRKAASELLQRVGGLLAPDVAEQLRRAVERRP